MRIALASLVVGVVILTPLTSRATERLLDGHLEDPTAPTVRLGAARPDDEGGGAGRKSCVLGNGGQTCLVGIIPGCGQVANHQYVKAGFFLGAMVITSQIAGHYLDQDVRTSGEDAVAVTFGAATMGLWVWSLYDAYTVGALRD